VELAVRRTRSNTEGACIRYLWRGGHRLMGMGCFDYRWDAAAQVMVGEGVASLAATPNHA